jgi:uncharacterized protein (DUF1919 family)
MLGRIRDRLIRDRENRRSERARKRLVEATRDVDFTIVSSNCLGGRIYQRIERPYNTPFVGVFLHAPCYLRLVENLEASLAEPLCFMGESRYESANETCRETPYPIAQLGDAEIHFLHYADEEECRSKWTARLARMDFDRVFLTFTDRDHCTREHLEAFDQLPYANKLCFTAADLPEFDSCVQIPEFANERCVGDLYEHFDLCEKNFDIAGWLSASDNRAKGIRRHLPV